MGWQKFFLWLAGDSLGNPSTEAEGEVDTLQRYLAKKLPGVEIPTATGHRLWQLHGRSGCR